LGPVEQKGEGEGERKGREGNGCVLNGRKDDRGDVAGTVQGKGPRFLSEYLLSFGIRTREKFSYGGPQRINHHKPERETQIYLLI